MNALIREGESKGREDREERKTERGLIKLIKAVSVLNEYHIHIM